MLNFKEWLAENEKTEGVKTWAGGALRTAGQVALQALGLPGPEELGLNTTGVGDAAKTAWDAYGPTGPLTQAQIEALKIKCAAKDRQSCDTLCSKTRSRKACAAVGKKKIGRRWIEIDPLARHR